ncbi:MAG: threonyl-tRNA synthetase editing domain-containing protein [bacterium]|nr:threonyl-tRNA synthetase editing domain-containing protein [bacterium]
MKVLLFYADKFTCTPTIKTLESFPEVKEKTSIEKAVLAFIHVEPKDLEDKNKTVTKLIKNLKWMMNKLNTNTVVLHSFAHLASEKADPEESFEIFQNAFDRLAGSGYNPVITPYGYFHDLDMQLPGNPMARIFKEF